MNRRLLYCLLVWLGLVPAVHAAGEQFILYDRNGWWTSDVNHSASKELNKLAAGNHEIKCLAFTPTGGWVIFYDQNGYVAQGIPDEAFQKIKEIAANNGTLKWIAFTPTDGWTLFWDQNGNWTRGGVADAASKQLVAITKNGGTFKSIAFMANGGAVILFDQNGYWSEGGIPDEAFKKLGDLAKKGSALQSIAFTPSGGWTLLWDQNGNWSRGIPDAYFQKMQEIVKNGGTLRAVAFAPLDFATGQVVLDTAPAQRVKATLTTDLVHPEPKVANWYLCVPEAPTLDRQQAVKTTFSPKGTIVKEGSPLQRPVFLAHLTDGRKEVHSVLTIEATLQSRRLRPLNAGEKAPSVPDLSAAEVKEYTRSSALMDLKAKPLLDWIDQAGLKRRSGESDLALGYRVFSYVKHHFTYQGSPPDWNVAVTCKAGKSDCGGLSALVTAVLRVNGVPARILGGRWAASQTDYGQWHCKGEFFAHGVGWVPFDMASAVNDTNGSDLNFFGNESGDFLTMHVDQDLLLDSFVSGKQNCFVVQSVYYWCSPGGDVKFKEMWTVQKEALPK